MVRSSEKFLRQFEVIHTGKIGVIIVRTNEPYRLRNIFESFCEENCLKLAVWTYRSSWTRMKELISGDSTDKAVEYVVDQTGNGATSVYSALEHLFTNPGAIGNNSIKEPDMINLLFFPHFDITNAQGSVNHYCVQSIIDLAVELPSTDSRVVMCVPNDWEIPHIIRDSVVVLSLESPTTEELSTVFKELLEYGVSDSKRDSLHKFTNGEINLICETGQGMSEIDFVTICSRVLSELFSVSKGEPFTFKQFLNRFQDFKVELVNQTGILSIMPSEDISNVGGLENLKKWLQVQKKCLTKKARKFGIDRVSGMLVCGVAGCLSGDTVIWYKRGKRPSGRNISLQNLYKKFNNVPGVRSPWRTEGKTYTLSHNNEGKIIFNEIIGVVDSGVKPVYEVTTETHKISATEDHKILCPTGKYKKVKDLVCGDEVVCKGTMLSYRKNGKLKKRSSRLLVETLKYYPNGNIHIVNGYVYKRAAKARLIFEAHINRISYDNFIKILKTDKKKSKKLYYLPKDYDVHHIDENPLNDSINNLMATSHREHARIHSKVENFNTNYTKIEKIKSIVFKGNEHTYDIMMKSPNNNFCANGIIVHNSGKSLIGKAVGSLLNRVVVRLDVQSLFSKYVGDTEQRTKQALKLIEDISPCVLLIDEINTVLSTNNGVTDGGVTSRIIGSMLTWMQETKKEIFFVMTANDISNMPPQLTRKGRIDEIFSVLMPTAKEREDILKIHLRKRGHYRENMGLENSIRESKGFVGSEIEAAVKEALKVAFYNDAETISDKDIETQFKRMIPMSKTYKQQIDNLTAWAKDNAIPAGSIEDRDSVHAESVPQKRRTIG